MAYAPHETITAEKGSTGTNSASAAAPLAAPAPSSMESHPAWTTVSRFPVLLAVSISLPGLRVRDLLALQPGQLIRTPWSTLADVPLSIGMLQLAWGEFDVLHENIAVRLTRLASLPPTSPYPR